MTLNVQNDPQRHPYRGDEVDEVYIVFRNRKTSPPDTKGDKTMNEEYLNLLTNIRDTLEEIQTLREDLADLLDEPAVTLEHLGKIRDALDEVQALQEDIDV